MATQSSGPGHRGHTCYVAFHSCPGRPGPTLLIKLNFTDWATHQGRDKGLEDTSKSMDELLVGVLPMCHKQHVLLLLALGLTVVGCADDPVSQANRKIKTCAENNGVYLDLSGSLLGNVPESIGELNNLQTLHLNDNILRSLPPEIGGLANLRTLHLGTNQLNTLPPEIGQLNNLTMLDLVNNEIKTLPSEMSKLSSLIDLNLSGNHLPILPPEVFQISSLERLYLGRLQFQTLPAEIGNLKKLHILDMGMNRLERLPPEIGNLKHLTWLDIGINPIKQLPPEIGQLTNLQRLNLNAVPITDDDLKHLRTLTALMELELRGTKVTRHGVLDLRARLPNCQIQSDFDGRPIEPSKPKVE